MKILSEIFTLDNLGHLVLYLILAGIIVALSYLVHPVAPAVVIPALWLFNREKLQWNCHIKDWDFRLGWPWQKPKWSLHKHMEYIPSSVFGAIVVLVVSRIIGLI